MEESMKTSHATLDATGTTIKSKVHFWAHRDELFSNVRQQPSEGIHVLSLCICNLVTKCTKCPFPKPWTCLNSWSCNMQCDTMRPDTGSDSRTSPSLPTSPFSPTANCWNLGASSTRKPGRGDELTSCPLQWQLLQHPLFTSMPLPPSPTATSAITHNHQTSAQHLASNAMPAVATITSLSHAGRGIRGTNSHVTLHTEVIKTPREVQAETEDIGPAILLAGNHTTTAAQVIAPPIALPTATPIALAIVHHPASLTVPSTSKPHTSTPRIVSMSYATTVMQPQPSPKVPCSWRDCPMVNKPSSPDFSFHPWWN